MSTTTKAPAPTTQSQPCEGQQQPAGWRDVYSEYARGPGELIHRLDNMIARLHKAASKGVAVLGNH